MDDNEIVRLYCLRDEDAIRETQAKYGRLCAGIARGVLADRADCAECLNDVWFALWNNVHVERPEHLKAYIARIARNTALNRFRYLTAEKRCAEAVCSLEELSECVSGGVSPEDEAERRFTERAISDFLSSQSPEKRLVFLRRYWYFDSMQRISDRTGFSVGKIKSMLFQMRRRLRDYLESEGISV